MRRALLATFAVLLGACGAVGDGCRVGGCANGLVCVALRDGVCTAECEWVCAKPCPCPDGCSCASDLNNRTFCAAPGSRQAACTK